MYANQYEEHQAHSAPCASRWDGFDRGTDWAAEDNEIAQRVIGRMTSESGHRVEVIIYEGGSADGYAEVRVNGKEVFGEFEGLQRALTVGRWWLNGCSA